MNCWVHTDQKAIKPPPSTPTPPQSLLTIRPILPRLHGEIRTQTHKHKERKDLERQTRDHDVDPILSLARVSRGRRIGQGTAGRLQYQGEDVGGDEDDGVGSWPEAREALAVDDDDAREAEVDAGGEEARGYC